MSALLVGLGVAVLAFAALGVLLMPGALARLHYVGVAPLGVVLVVAGVLVDKGPSLIGLKALTLGVFLLVTSPVLSHVCARAIHQRRERRR
ncbi:MAG: multicomponent Na+:H+ antiporter subunit [Solirubrobacteraceae bacterium]|nr:multicomponent Na+:H+ antiporter subunit [Solirubrobacteraceae bacterium]